MARMPGAIWKPLAANWASQPRMRAYDIFCLHTMVGSLVGTDGYFKVGNGAGYGGTESHFGVGPDGTIYQWQDTDFQADANGNGNHHIISSENADTGAPFPAWGGSNVPAFTPQQVEANARIAAWLNDVHGIPLDLIPDAKPGRRGIGWHRQGVPGYMAAGAEKWSSAPGKVCPGDRRIAQAPAISTRAKQIRSGALATPTVQEDDTMALTDRIPDLDKRKAGDPNATVTLEQAMAIILQSVNPPNVVSNLIHGEHIPDFDRDAREKRTGTKMSLGTAAGAAARAGTAVTATVAGLQGQVAGLTTALQAVAQAPTSTVDLDAVFKAAQDGARSIVDNLKVVAEPAS